MATCKTRTLAMEAARGLTNVDDFLDVFLDNLSLDTLDQLGYVHGTLEHSDDDSGAIWIKAKKRANRLTLLTQEPGVYPRLECVMTLYSNQAKCVFQVKRDSDTVTRATSSLIAYDMGQDFTQAFSAVHERIAAHRLD